MKVLFLSYWGAGEGLTAATVFPHVNILAELPFVEAITLCTIERAANIGSASLPSPKVTHFPLRSLNLGLNAATKSVDVMRFGTELTHLVRARGIDALICRSSLAGALGAVAHAVTRVPYLVESFEPHAEYAVEAGAWHPFGPKAAFLRAAEWVQLRTATGIMPVAHGYAGELLTRGLSPARLRVVPCAVPLESFAFLPEARRSVREQHSLGSASVGIYVGKFGGMYYDREAFEVFRATFDSVPGFRLIILTPNPAEEVSARLREAGVDVGRVVVKSVPHSEVPRYLSAADFAYALYAPAPSKRALSPIKNGEYWASGLPVLLTEGVGDEASFLESEGAGAILSARRDNVAKAIARILTIAREPNSRARIAEVARRHRSFDAVRSAYVAFLEPLAQRAPTAS